MSVECGECERDLRGGHDPECSRYVLRICKCGHKAEEHDEEGFCSPACEKCYGFELSRVQEETKSC